MDAVGGVEHAHEKHAGEDQNASVESRGATTPFIDEHEGDDSGDADEDGGDAGCEEGGFGGGYAGLLE